MADGKKDDKGRAEVPEALKPAVAELEEKRRKGELTAFEFAAKKKALLKSAAAKEAAPAKEEPAKKASVKEAAPAGPPKDEEKKVKMPEAWAKKDKALRAGPRLWKEGARTDDPTKRALHEPLGPGIGTGKSFLFLFGFRVHSDRDQEFLKKELEQIDDDIQVLRQAGYKVVVDPQATRQDFIDAVAGSGEGVAGLVPAGIYWSAHGSEDGSVQTCDGGHVVPEDLDPAKTSAGLKLMIFASCYVGSRAKKWRAALGGRPMVVGWGQPVTIDRAVEFLQSRADTETDLDDLIARYLLTDAPLPAETAGGTSSLAEATDGARLGDVPDRLRTVVEMLGAKTRLESRWMVVDVPLEDKRWQNVKVFIVESAEPYCEGEPMLAAESDVGEITAVVEPQLLLGSFSGAGYARVALVRSGTDMPRIVVQGFLPIARVRDQDLAALVYQVGSLADHLENRVFGGDRT
jgi:hypothetical protein